MVALEVKLKSKARLAGDRGLASLQMWTCILEPVGIKPDPQIKFLNKEGSIKMSNTKKTYEDKFSLALSQTKGGNYLSKAIDAGKYDEMVNALEVGSKLILKVYEREGRTFGYLEIIDAKSVAEYEAAHPRPANTNSI